MAARLARCERPAELPADWPTCATEACRRAKELPIHTANAQKHHRCADLIDDVREQVEQIKAQQP